MYRVYLLVITIMFSVSSAEFSGLPVFVDKVSKVSKSATATDAGGADTSFSSEFDGLRSWCLEQGMTVNYSKTSSGGLFYTLKYDRAKLTDEQYATLGRFRSVVFDDSGKICCIAPPKMLKLSDALSSAEVNSAGGYLHAEELVEGVMFNLFFSGEKWYVATKSCVGEVSYDHMKDAPHTASSLADGAADAAADGEAKLSSSASSSAFQKLSIQEVLRRRICDTLSLLTNGVEAAPKQYCYSFVLQHPKNQIVVEVSAPKLFLVAVYELSALTSGDCSSSVGVNAIRLERDIFSTAFSGSVFHMPSGLSCVADSTDDTSATFTPHTVDDYCKMYGSHDTRGAMLPGVVFRDADTGFCYKKRNPKYESVKKRKGVELKLLTQYLYLRKERTIDEYLGYHPQHNRVFNDFRERLHDYTSRLYSAYIEHYVKKDNKPLKEYERELRTHMYKLHYDVFLATMKESGTFVTKHTVINYVNNLAPPQQLACLSAGAGAAPTHVSHENPDSKRRFLPKAGSSSAGGHDGVKDGSEYKNRQPRGGSLAARGGFRTPRGNGSGSRGRGGGSQVPSLTFHVQADVVDRSKGVKSATPGTVKVQNRFSGLDTDTQE
jgi:hypothetical protein